MKIVLRFKKRGMKRFLSTLESIKFVERALRRAEFPLIFTEGFHPKPKMSFLDAMPVGVVNLAFYVEVHVKSISIDYVENLKKNLPNDFFLENVWIFDESINKIVTSYRFKIITPHYIDLLSKEVEKKGKKLLFKENVEDFEVSRLRKYYIFRYTQRRERLINPFLLIEKADFFLPICEEALVEGGETLSNLLERRGIRVKKNSSCR
ncbi:TIGR03936 family radical SAM-associated protein [Thermotoga sp. KOL6]|uniref:TIGR03936 family radical SAM-associated protein n=1 Tax=Thermotoga sp. KOL6 TaxID=126741 RepID=UPI000C75D044|nr:TIGR03936 family radical SAM-associated protein [Thermotoga sp. KOL6]PLV59195.1 hypothetical protein AS005_05460 [Thermotoga sp. KOL6]